MNAEDDNVLRRAALKAGKIVDKGRLGSDTIRNSFEAAWPAISAELPRRRSGNSYSADDVEIIEKFAALEGWQAAQSQPAPPVPASVQEIMPLVNAYVRDCGEFLISGDDGADEALKPLQTALTALVEKNHELQFSLDGVNAMRRPLTEAELTAIHSLPYVRACLMEYRHWPVDETASAVVKAIAVQISALAASPPTNGVEPEQGESHAK